MFVVPRFHARNSAEIVMGIRSQGIRFSQKRGTIELITQEPSRTSTPLDDSCVTKRNISQDDHRNLLERVRPLDDTCVTRRTISQCGTGTF